MFTLGDMGNGGRLDMEYVTLVKNSVVLDG
jgi:hypothetical protein